jgi:XTP/dITP diphosphohydrolase
LSKVKLLLATTNRGKAKEIKSYLKGLPLEIYSLEEAGLKETFPERGKTFSENARGKSLFYSKNWEGLTLAEDSGLEIDHLQGAPGILSARFSGSQATNEKNNQKVLELLKGVPIEQRKARFVSYLVLSRRGEIIREIEEHVKGLIAFEKRGSHGFGYDPLFLFPPLGKTFAELHHEEKNKVSHRGRALKKLKEFLLQYLRRAANST